MRIPLDPIVSILIPTFENYDGLNSILSAFELCSVQDLSRVCIVISDDSLSALLSDRDLVYYFQKFPNFCYRWNSSPLGVVANWNSLIKSSQTAFNWLLHHDEVPANIITGLSALLQILLVNKPKLVILPVFKLYNLKIFTKISCFQRHTPHKNPLFAFLRFPLSLLFCNYIGPPSALIVSQSLSYEFDPRYKWYVDSIAYIDLLFKIDRADLYVVASDSFFIVSDQSFTGSISAAIKNDLSMIKHAEWHLIRNKYPALNVLHWAIGSAAYAYLKILSVLSLVLVKG